MSLRNLIDLRAVPLHDTMRGSHREAVTRGNRPGAAT
jgi:hypothetical protein